MYQYKETHLYTALPAVGKLLESFDPGLQKQIFQEADQPQLQRPYLAFEQVRKCRALPEIYQGDLVISAPQPIKLEPTGFEGYFRGFNLKPFQLAGIQAMLGREILRKIDAEWEYPVAKSLHLALEGTNYTRYSVVMIQELAGIIHKMKALDHHPKCDTKSHGEFRQQTYDQISSLPSVKWDLSNPALGLRQEICLSMANPLPDEAVQVNFSSEELSGYKVMMELGRIGHPLIRATADSLSENTDKLFSTHDFLFRWRKPDNYPLPDIRELITNVYAKH